MADTTMRVKIKTRYGWLMRARVLACIVLLRAAAIALGSGIEIEHE